LAVAQDQVLQEIQEVQAVRAGVLVIMAMDPMRELLGKEIPVVHRLAKLVLQEVEELVQ
jgi:hypothetical protein